MSSDNRQVLEQALNSPEVRLLVGVQMGFSGNPEPYVPGLQAGDGKPDPNAPKIFIYCFDTSIDARTEFKRVEDDLRRLIPEGVETAYKGITDSNSLSRGYNLEKFILYEKLPPHRVVLGMEYDKRKPGQLEVSSALIPFEQIQVRLDTYEHRVRRIQRGF